MKFGFIIFTFLCLILSCSKEQAPCNVSSFIGTWKVKNNIICEVDSTNEFVIEQGPWPSQIQMKYGADTLVYTVIDCKAKHASSDLGWMRTSEMIVNDGEIEFKHNRLVLILWQNCSMTLVRK
ncbi:MAG: hypothetical protein R2774_00815 [Saprospiraceae bacterium]